MKKQTFEKALHSWDNWYESIKRSRKQLGFNVKWPINIRRGWIKKHYSEVRKQAEIELRRLDLPNNLREYWEDCLYSDYRSEEGRSDLSIITRCLSKRKSLPELPCDVSLVWHEGEDTCDPWLRVELKVHAGFITKELFDYAGKLAYETVKFHVLSQKRLRSKIMEPYPIPEGMARSTLMEPHPIRRWLKGGRPHVEDEDIAIECAHLRDDEHWTFKEIGRKYGWKLQKDSNGNLSQCSTARNYVKWGRELRDKYQQ